MGKPCGEKKRYDTQENALKALHAIWAKPWRGRPVPSRVYPCPHCKGWHLTHQPRGRRRGGSAQTPDS